MRMKACDPLERVYDLRARRSFRLLAAFVMYLELRRMADYNRPAGGRKMLN